MRYLENYTSCYNNERRGPDWALEYIDPKNVTCQQAKKSTFTTDNKIHSFYRTYKKDMKKSTFTRGHIAAAGNYNLNQNHKDNTYLLSNVAPQVSTLNDGKWNELESHVRKLATHQVDVDVYCISGTLFMPSKSEIECVKIMQYEVIGSGISVPTHFYKIIFLQDKTDCFDIEAYIMPNEQIPKSTLSKFQVSPKEIERASGYLFLNRIPKCDIKLINGKKKPTVEDTTTHNHSESETGTEWMKEFQSMTDFPRLRSLNYGSGSE